MQRRQTGDQSQNHPADDKQDRVGDLELARDDRQRCDGEQKSEHEFNGPDHEVRVGFFEESASQLNDLAGIQNGELPAK
jgi:hypothetical protein